MMWSFFSSRPVGAPVLLLSLVAVLSGCGAAMHHREGLSALKAGDPAKGIAELGRAAEMEPQNIDYRRDWLRNRETVTNSLLAKAEQALANRNPVEAEKHYRTVLAYERENARALAGLDLIARSMLAASEAAAAQAAIGRGETSAAKHLADRALELDTQQPVARAVRRELERLNSQELVVAPSLSNLYKKPIDLEFRETSVKMVFDALSRTTGINFIFDRDVKTDQRTTVFLKKTALDDAIDVILAGNQLEKKILNATSVLIYPNTPAKTREYQDLIVRVFYLANVEAKQAANMLRTVLKIKDVFVDDKYNMLILRENPETIVLAEKLVTLHDLEEPEVMLEVEVLEVSRNNLLNLGVQLSNQLTVSPLASLTTGGAGGAAGANSSTLKLSDLLNLNRNLLGVTTPSLTINVAKSDGNARLLANPRLRVRDREKAKILIGDKVPVVTTTTSGTFVSENIQYLDVGLKLEVEPEIHLRDEVGLKMSLEVSSLVSSVKTSSGSQAYQIGTRNVSSALRLRDGETQVLAGLISDADRSDAARIPLLGDLPLLGRLFSSQKDDRQRTEIVMSITPHLIRNIRRKDPSAESFWSGTEANLRTRPVQLRSVEPAAAAGTPVHSAGAAAAAGDKQTEAALAPVAAPDNSGVSVSWKGPMQARLGETVTLQLDLSSAHLLRAAPLQVAFNPAHFDIVSVTQGDYFSREEKGTFSQAVDKASGRISISAAGKDTGVKGTAQLVTIQLRPLLVAPALEIQVSAMTPIGAAMAIAQPKLPVSHALTVVQ